MTIGLLFFLLLISYSSCLSLPASLKCADKECKKIVSAGRLLQHVKFSFGDLQELKKSTKVNIKGKNVDSSNSLWLVECDGLTGFVDFSLIKENRNSVVNDLEVVTNPYSKSNVFIDETEANDDEGDSILFSKRDVILKSNKDTTKDETENIDDDEANSNSDSLVKDNLISVDNKKEIILHKNLPAFTDQQIVHDRSDTLKNLYESSSTINKETSLADGQSQSINESVNVHEDLSKMSSESDVNKVEIVQREAVSSNNVNINYEDLEKSVNVHKAKIKNEITSNMVSESEKSEKIEQILTNNIEINDHSIEIDKDLVKDIKYLNKMEKTNETLALIDHLDGDKDSVKNIEVLSETNKNHQLETDNEVKTDRSKELHKDFVENIHESDQIEKIIKTTTENKNLVDNSKEGDKDLDHNIIMPYKPEKVHKVDTKNVEYKDNSKSNDEDLYKNIEEPDKIEKIVSKENKEINDHLKSDNVVVKNIKESDKIEKNHDAVTDYKETKGRSKEFNIDLVKDILTRDNLEEVYQPISEKKIEVNKDLIKNIEEPNSLDKIHEPVTQNKETKDNVPESKEDHDNIENNHKTGTKDDDMSATVDMKENKLLDGEKVTMEKDQPGISSVTKTSNDIKEFDDKKVDNSSLQDERDKFPNSYNEDRTKVIVSKDVTVEKDGLENSSPTTKTNEIQDTTTKINSSLDANKPYENTNEQPFSETEVSTQSENTVNDQVIVEKVSTSMTPESQTPEDHSANAKDEKMTSLDKEVTSSDKEVTSSDKEVTSSHKEVTSSNKEDKVNIPSRDSDPWLFVPDATAFDSTEERLRSVRSPFLIGIIKLEKCLQSFVQLIIKKTSLDSSLYLNRFVHNWLCMSIENFVLILSLFSSIVIVAYTPKMFRLKRDWKYEFEKQRNLVVELESKLLATEDVRQKLTVQNHTFEKTLDEYKCRMTEIQEDAKKNQKTILADFEVMKKINENKIEKLSQDLEIRIAQCGMLEEDVMTKEMMVEELNEDLSVKETEFSDELAAKESKINDLEQELLQIDGLRQTLENVSSENEDLKEKIASLSGELRVKNDEFNKLNSTFESLRLFEGYGEEECREKVQRCLQYNDVRLELVKVEEEAERLKKSLEEAIQQIGDLELNNKQLEQLTLTYKEQQSQALKDQEASDTRLKVLTDYFHKKEIEMQKSLGHESIEKSQFVDKVENYRSKIVALEAENESLSQTIEKLKAEAKQCQTFANECKNDANTQIANAFMSMSHMERELAMEREESKQLRVKLSYYMGPVPARTNQWGHPVTTSTANNHSKERPPSRQSVTSDHHNAPMPPIFPLSLLQPASNSQRSPFSGRNSVNSVSKKSNNS